MGANSCYLEIKGVPIPADLKRSRQGRSYWPQAVRDWRDVITQTAIAYKLSTGNTWKFDKHTAFIVNMAFVFNRPDHLPDVVFIPRRHDLDKLARAVNDAISDCLISDDSSIIKQTLEKEYVHGVESCLRLSVEKVNSNA